MKRKNFWFVSLKLILILAISINSLSFLPNIALANGTNTRIKIINKAKEQIGQPYYWGSGWPTPEGLGLDCSGLVNYCYTKDVV